MITRSHGCDQSHGSVTSVVRATREVNGRRQNYPSQHTHTPLPTVAKYCARDYVQDISQQATFGQDRPMGYFSPYSQSYHLIIFYLQFYYKLKFGRHLQVLWLHIKICPLAGVSGDQQLPVFILGPFPYLSN